MHLNIRGTRKLQQNFVNYLKVNVTGNESEFSDGLSTKSKESFSTVNRENFFRESQFSTSNEDICLGQHLNNLRRSPHSPTYQYQLHLL